MAKINTRAGSTKIRKIKKYGSHVTCAVIELRFEDEEGGYYGVDLKRYEIDKRSDLTVETVEDFADEWMRRNPESIEGMTLVGITVATRTAVWLPQSDD